MMLDSGTLPPWDPRQYREDPLRSTTIGVLADAQRALYRAEQNLADYTTSCAYAHPTDHLIIQRYHRLRQAVADAQVQYLAALRQVLAP